MAKLSKEEIKEIKEFINEVKSNNYYKIRNSEFFEPWDTEPETFKEIGDNCYYFLNDAICLLKNLIDDGEDL